MNCVQHHKTHVDRRARGRVNSRLHTPTTRPNTEHQFPNTDTKPKLKTRVPGSEHHTPTRAHSKPRTHIKTGLDGSVRALSQNSWMTPDRSDRTLTFSFISEFEPEFVISTGARAPVNVTRVANSQSHVTWRASAKCQLHSLLTRVSAINFSAED